MANEYQARYLLQSYTAAQAASMGEFPGFGFVEQARNRRISGAGHFMDSAISGTNFGYVGVNYRLGDGSSVHIPIPTTFRTDVGGRTSADRYARLAAQTQIDVGFIDRFSAEGVREGLRTSIDVDAPHLFKQTYTSRTLHEWGKQFIDEEGQHLVETKSEYFRMRMMAGAPHHQDAIDALRNLKGEPGWSVYGNPDKARAPLTDKIVLYEFYDELLDSKTRYGNPIALGARAVDADEDALNLLAARRRVGKGENWSPWEAAAIKQPAAYGHWSNVEIRQIGQGGETFASLAGNLEGGIDASHPLLRKAFLEPTVRNTQTMARGFAEKVANTGAVVGQIYNRYHLEAMMDEMVNQGLIVPGTFNFVEGAKISPEQARAIHRARPSYEMGVDAEQHALKLATGRSGMDPDATVNIFRRKQIKLTPLGHYLRFGKISEHLDADQLTSLYEKIGRLRNKHSIAEFGTMIQEGTLLSEVNLEDIFEMDKRNPNQIRATKFKTIKDGSELYGAKVEGGDKLWQRLTRKGGLFNIDEIGGIAQYAPEEVRSSTRAFGVSWNSPNAVGKRSRLPMGGASDGSSGVTRVIATTMKINAETGELSLISPVDSIQEAVARLEGLTIEEGTHTRGMFEASGRFSPSEILKGSSGAESIAKVMVEMDDPGAVKDWRPGSAYSEQVEARKRQVIGTVRREHQRLLDAGVSLEDVAARLDESDVMAPFMEAHDVTRHNRKFRLLQETLNIHTSAVGSDMPIIWLENGEVAVSESQRSQLGQQVKIIRDGATLGSETDKVNLLLKADARYGVLSGTRWADESSQYGLATMWSKGPGTDAPYGLEFDALGRRVGQSQRMMGRDPTYRANLMIYDTKIESMAGTDATAAEIDALRQYIDPVTGETSTMPGGAKLAAESTGYESLEAIERKRAVLRDPNTPLAPIVRSAPDESLGIVKKITERDARGYMRTYYTADRAHPNFLNNFDPALVDRTIGGEKLNLVTVTSMEARTVGGKTVNITTAMSADELFLKGRFWSTMQEIGASMGIESPEAGGPIEEMEEYLRKIGATRVEEATINYRDDSSTKSRGGWVLENQERQFGVEGRKLKDYDVVSSSREGSRFSGIVDDIADRIGLNGKKSMAEAAQEQWLKSGALQHIQSQRMLDEALARAASYQERGNIGAAREILQDYSDSINAGKLGPGVDMAGKRGSREAARRSAARSAAAAAEELSAQAIRGAGTDVQATTIRYARVLKNMKGAVILGAAGTAAAIGISRHLTRE